MLFALGSEAAAGDPRGTDSQLFDIEGSITQLEQMTTDHLRILFRSGRRVGAI
ncbi:MAG: hypothetical protein AAF517_04215 [Planctomycetota bacterium]